ncbi:hypothetical protein VPH35_124183 [Triticum aestivum]
MVCRGSGPGRWCRWTAQGATERWMSGRRLRDFAALRTSASCRLGDEVAFDVARCHIREAGHVECMLFISTGGSRGCSSHSGHGFFSPTAVEVVCSTCCRQKWA